MSEQMDAEVNRLAKQARQSADVASLCPKCGAPMTRRPGMFYWQGRSFSGLVCGPCKSLWDDPEDSFAEHVGIPKLKADP